MTELRLSMKQNFDNNTFMENVLNVNTEDIRLDEILLEIVNFLRGGGYSEELIKQYINYDSENYCVDKIGE